MAQCLSKMLMALMAMRCIRKNWCGWLAVTIQMRLGAKLAILCIRLVAEAAHFTLTTMASQLSWFVNDARRR